MKIIIDARVEDTPLKSTFEVNVPEKYVTKLALAGEAFSIIRRALFQFEESFREWPRDSDKD